MQFIYRETIQKPTEMNRRSHPERLRRFDVWRAPNPGFPHTNPQKDTVFPGVNTVISFLSQQLSHSFPLISFTTTLSSFSPSFLQFPSSSLSFHYFIIFILILILILI